MVLHLNYKTTNSSSAIQRKNPCKGKYIPKYSFWLILSLLFVFSCEEKKEEFTLFINIQPENTGITDPISGQKFEEGTSVEVSATPISGYKFNKWSGDATGEQNPTIIEMDSDKNITAVFGKKNFSLNITIDGKGTVDEKIILQKAVDYEYGTNVQLTAIADIGWKFDGWSGDKVSVENPIVVAIDTIKNINVKFDQIEYMVNLEIEGSGVIESDPFKEYYYYGDSVKFKAVAADNFVFNSWYGDVSGTNNPFSIVIDSSLTIGAKFERKYIVSLEVEGSGSIESNPKKDFYLYGDTLVLTAVPETGFIFSSWYGDTSAYVNPISIVIDSDLNIGAEFTESSTQTIIKSAYYSRKEGFQINWAEDIRADFKSYTLQFSKSSSFSNPVNLIQYYNSRDTTFLHNDLELYTTNYYKIIINYDNGTSLKTNIYETSNFPQIAYVDDSDITRSIKLYNIKNGNKRRVSSSDIKERDPVFSFDGNSLAYWNTNGQIIKYNMIDSTLVSLFSNTFTGLRDPKFLPDGQVLVKGENSILYSANFGWDDNSYIWYGASPNGDVNGLNKATYDMSSTTVTFPIDTSNVSNSHLTFDNNNIIFQVSVPDSVVSIYYASIKDAQPTGGVTDTIPANFLVKGKLLRTSPYDTKFIFIDECDLYTMDYNTESIDKLVDLSDCIIDANFMSSGKSVVVESEKKKIYIYDINGMLTNEIGDGLEFDIQPR